ncbi:class I SAM-dependent methyltransferase [Rhizobium sp. P38BS-XIX]|uniref:SAM-dependent methyltransferase n=1 Tax=Rhizobium sp. P38BS-XIX TaxID=2726740 RepID=UPI001456459B|nr:cyclopropane-fatty-acyl-phospholipid synthase family protein [Rhizobium sp. P38BS-XIX]NLR97098.1 class I SAM-dependent methyltransferase [Rhizobium sp. P38BS-XIX]
MSSLDESSRAPIDLSEDSGRFGWAGKIIDRLFGTIAYGRLRLVLPAGQIIEKRGRHHGPEASITICRWRMLRRVVAAGDIGFAESFIDGDWTTPDLTAVIRFAARNSEALAPAIEGGLPMRLLNRVKHLLNANTKRGSRRNIEAHYDLGNAFYKEWLDPSMLYSSAIFDMTTPTLEAAQQKKLETIAEKLDLSGGESILEIGFGWGALALHLAEKSDASVTGITLSPSQLDWARHAVEISDVSDKIDLSLKDYRDIDGQFDRIVSIEMFEAVGEAYWPSYFDTLKRCLKPGGRAVLQIISIEEQRFATYRNTTDFIQKYIFPGGFLPSDSVLSASVRAAGLKITATDHFGRSYARTLAEWRARFEARWPVIAELGFDERFRRLWHYYLCYCEAGFEEGTINVGLYTIEPDHE